MIDSSWVASVLKERDGQDLAPPIWLFAFHIFSTSFPWRRSRRAESDTLRKSDRSQQENSRPYSILTRRRQLISLPRTTRTKERSAQYHPTLKKIIPLPKTLISRRSTRTRSGVVARLRSVDTQKVIKFYKFIIQILPRHNTPQLLCKDLREAILEPVKNFRHSIILEGTLLEPLSKCCDKQTR